MRVRTPTFANIPALLHMLPGCKLPGRAGDRAEHRPVHFLH